MRNGECWIIARVILQSGMRSSRAAQTARDLPQCRLRYANQCDVDLTQMCELARQGFNASEVPRRLRGSG